MRPISGRVTSRFDSPRPLNDPGKHIHGALDIAAPVGTEIYAPESGTIFASQSVRPAAGLKWPEKVKIDRWVNPFVNYFYDVYGGVLVLRSDTASRTHIITHSYANQLFNRVYAHRQKLYVESSEDARFPYFFWYTRPEYVKEGDLIGLVGNSGYSTGAHIHWEIHPLHGWVKHEKRIDPEDFA